MKSSNQLNQGLTFFITVLLLFVISRASLANEIQTADIQPMSDIRWQDVDGNTHHLQWQTAIVALLGGMVFSLSCRVTRDAEVAAGK
jgi:hypothetical protein